MSIKTRVKEYIADNLLMGTGTEIGDTDSLLALGVIDSTGVLELVAFLEQTFGIRVSDEEMIPENLDTLNSIETYVQQKAAPARAGAQA